MTNLSISIISHRELNEIDFSVDVNSVTPGVFRTLVRRLAHGIDIEHTKELLSAAFKTGRISDNEIAEILHATWFDMSKINEILELIEQ